jgi:TonB family protein
VGVDHDIHRTGTRGGLLGSVVIHGLIVLLLLLIATQRDSDPPKPTPTVDIVTIDPPPPIVINPGPTGGAKSLGAAARIVDPAMGKSGKRGHTAAPIEARKSDNPYDELTRTVDHGPDVGTGGSDHGDGPGRGLYGNGYDGLPGNGIGGGMGGMGVPSLKRPPSPREDYSQSSEKFPEKYAGSTVAVALELDAEGHVTSATLQRGVGDAHVDDRIVDMIRKFQFWPALDDTGKPIAATYKWLWVLQPPHD